MRFGQLIGLFAFALIFPSLATTVDAADRVPHRHGHCRRNCCPDNGGNGGNAAPAGNAAGTQTNAGGFVLTGVPIILEMVPVAVSGNGLRFNSTGNGIGLDCSGSSGLETRVKNLEASLEHLKSAIAEQDKALTRIADLIEKHPALAAPPTQ